MSIWSRLRLAVSERKIRCRNCGSIMDTNNRFCSDTCARDYNSMSDAEWQAHG